MYAILFCLFGSIQTLASQLDRSTPLVSTPQLIAPCSTVTKGCVSIAFDNLMMNAGIQIVLILHKVHSTSFIYVYKAVASLQGRFK